METNVRKRNFWISDERGGGCFWERPSGTSEGGGEGEVEWLY